MFILFWIPPVFSEQKDLYADAMDLLTRRIRHRVAVWIKESGKYLDMIQAIFEEEGLPTELSYLPLIESGYNIYAVSPAGAVGMWQFVGDTAKRYGLMVNNCVDERLDPEKSTRAAARYLKDLYDLFGTWDTALMAYNAGEYLFMNRDGSMRKVSYSRIPLETRRYVPLFRAAVEIMQNPAEYGYSYEVYPFNESYKTVSVKGSLKKMAKKHKITIRELKRLNPAVICENLSFVYPLRVP